MQGRSGKPAVNTGNSFIKQIVVYLSKLKRPIYCTMKIRLKDQQLMWSQETQKTVKLDWGQVHRDSDNLRGKLNGVRAELFMETWIYSPNKKDDGKPK